MWPCSITTCIHKFEMSEKGYTTCNKEVPQIISQNPSHWEWLMPPGFKTWNTEDDQPANKDHRIKTTIHTQYSVIKLLVLTRDWTVPIVITCPYSPHPSTEGRELGFLRGGPLLYNLGNCTTGNLLFIMSFCQSLGFKHVHLVPNRWISSYCVWSAGQKTIFTQVAGQPSYLL